MMRTATLRLKQDYLRLAKEPIPYVCTIPVPDNILEWHYVVIGTPDTPYQGGFYHGKLVFPQEFPFKPPSIYMSTPNGRFKTNTRLCLSISDFHPETWNPTWSAGPILLGLQSFMCENTPTLGSVESSDHEKRLLAEQSIEFNLRDRQFCELFPKLAEECRDILKNRETERRQLEALVPPAIASGVNQMQSSLAAALTNLCVVVGFAAFAFVVKYVITLSGSDQEHP
ncbi:ubiquitin-conjugating enzyme E2 J2-like isoform X1 [Varroa jacobsoni]|uniref:Ubiquitin-conjugating enzyme E2 J2 n=1 Tax=Varroa destructor TaxID=109461 RepID=A0A7M7KHD0_VARDE|nr:ubiquitin-conjugating enzyme E2 J2-like isoform X1 [Varroa destructor]XP_022666893.1 ubiquitin-conjugating enzyme E2 J2-like isoform X1 [Varroa destructor]XP_022666894.1 ubiquitin-conjugating enzyme E2 J2-like isoform X1 [Varroa destructor]XP_022666895.1 ubiquitin-conjugating enzyme E2 J2-like isoform X1 [Varroa destructor]XP_022666897.1 ubiquitin-conjugating enzyme E2 J2-like isoform X1 [Varroa destructor]XP_022700750.1 ubiquitin-conjugating enzyme E2 J2-like isoform X1 [Varroa jacobsoni]